MLLLWSRIEVFRCSAWRGLEKVSETAGTVRTSATTDGGFHTATFSYIRWDECDSARYRGRLHSGEERELPCQQQRPVRWAQQPPTEFLPQLKSPREMPVCFRQSRPSLRTSPVSWRAIWESGKLSWNQKQICRRNREAWPAHKHENYT